MTNHAVSNRADPRERTKTMSRHGDRRGQIADFRDSFETINWLYLLFKCGIKTKTHFEWLLWHCSSLGQLNLEPTRPSGLVGCKMPTDLVKISVKEATHMGFHYKIEVMHKRSLENNGFRMEIPNKACAAIMGTTMTIIHNHEWEWFSFMAAVGPTYIWQNPLPCTHRIIVSAMTSNGTYAANFWFAINQSK